MNDALSEHSLISSIKEYLLPVASLITPNIPEAIALAGKDPQDPADACAAAIWNSNSNCACLITGTHAESEQVINRYYRQGKISREWTWQRLPYEYHGSGCTLASACAAGLAHGLSMEQAVEQAQQHVMKSLSAGFNPGKGQHIPYRLCSNPAVEVV
jgi:hydroxymethylpyrimidine/phosphomethylpyrimidine kinase